MDGDIVVVGSLNMDLVVQVSRPPQPGETIAARAFATSIGGKGANQAAACARLGAGVRMIGRVGRDGFGEQMVRELAATGVDVRCVERTEGASGMAFITVDDLTENSIIIVHGANSRLSTEELAKHAVEIERAAVVLTQLETPLETVLRVSEMAVGSGVPLVLDPAPAMELPGELLKRVTWLTPNETESRILLRDAAVREPAETAERLLRMGCRNVALKLGAAGVFLAGADTPAVHVRGFAVEAVDTTAAGDAFNGAFAVALGRGEEPEAAARFACAAAAISVTRRGAVAAMATRDEVLGLLGR